MDKAGQILQAAGMSYGDLVANRVALRDMANFAAMNEVYRTYWEKDRPARVSAHASIRISCVWCFWAPARRTACP